MPDSTLFSRAVIWCAVSDAKQAEEGKESLPSQERDGLEACAREGLQVVAVLKVPGYSRDYIDIRDCAEDMSAAGYTALGDLYEMIRANSFSALVFRRGEGCGRTRGLFPWIVKYIIKTTGGRFYETSRKRWID